MVQVLGAGERLLPLAITSAQCSRETGKQTRLLVQDGDHLADQALVHHGEDIREMNNHWDTPSSTDQLHVGRPLCAMKTSQKSPKMTFLLLPLTDRPVIQRISWTEAIPTV